MIYKWFRENCNSVFYANGNCRHKVFTTDDEATNLQGDTFHFQHKVLIELSPNFVRSCCLIIQLEMMFKVS